MAKETESGKEPKNYMGKAVGKVMDKVHSLFGGKSNREEGADEYHDRREHEELKGMGMEDEHAMSRPAGHDGIDHPQLKILMAKLNTPMGHDDQEEETPSSLGKGGFKGMMNKA